jgi:hypothetical protein
LNIVEQHKVGLASQQTMIDLQAGTDRVQARRAWYMQTISMPQSNSNVRKTPSRSSAAVDCFSYKKHSRNSRMPHVYINQKEVMPLKTKISIQSNPIVKIRTKNSNI